MLNVLTKKKKEDQFFQIFYAFSMYQKANTKYKS